MNLRFLLKLMIALSVLALCLAACKPAAQTPATLQPPVASSQAHPAAPQPTAAEAAAPQNMPSGVNLENPAAGLDALTGYRQAYTHTLKGSWQAQPYESAQAVERAVRGADSVLRASEASTGSAPVAFFSGRIGGFFYSQSAAGSACRAEPAESAPADSSDPARQLPPVYGMQPAGSEDLDGQPALRYTFDARSLIDPDHAIQTASGEAWLAEDGGLLLKFQLTVEIASADFTSTRTWSYQLIQTGVDEALRLPAGCQPVLADLPVLPGAADVMQMPGFQRYSAGSGRADAVAFYHAQLTGLGWLPLPGSAPEEADLSEDLTVLAYAQPYYEGGRLLVIQLSESGGKVQVTAQSALTKAPVQMDSMDTAAAAESEAEDEPPADDSAPAALPTDLPIYPGATVVTKIENAAILQVEASVAEIADFYESELRSAGWTLYQRFEHEGMVALNWSRENAHLTVTIRPAGDGSTQVMISGG